MFDYYIVLGGSLDPYQYLQNTIAMIQKVFHVVDQSKFYVGPSEDPEIHDSFMNVALHLMSSKCIDEINLGLKEIEMRQLNQGCKIVDIDLIIQMKGDQVLYQSSKIKYCHSLITLKDVFLSECQSRSLIMEKYNANPSAHLFLPFRID